MAKNDCLTKSDIKNFAGNVGKAIGFVAGLIVFMVGMVTSLDATFDWLAQPSETELLRRQVSDLKHEVRLNNMERDGNHLTVWYTSPEEDNIPSRH